MPEVLVVGAGPVGLFLAALLAREGVDTAVWEARTDPGTHSRAIGVHGRSLEVLDRIGVGEVLADAATHVRRGVARARGRELGAVDFSCLRSPYPFVATVPQQTTEQILSGAAHGLGVAVHRGVRLEELRSEPGGVVVTGRAAHGIRVQERARMLVGADGADSTVRRLLGAPTSRRTYADTYVMGDFADPDGTPDAVIHLEPGGVVESFPLPGGRRRAVVRTGGPVRDPSPDQLARIVAHRTGTALDPATSTMVSAFGTRCRLVRAMVHGRVVLIGDAAHEISPIGGQGMNLGLLDAAAFAPVLAPDTRVGADHAGELATVGRRRLRSARIAARCAELNMALGRPHGELGHLVRAATLRGALHTPARDGLAAVYAMRWA